MPGQFGSIQQVSAACQPTTSPSPTYGASYPHCSLWCLSRAACGCCPRLPSGLGPGRRRSWPRSTDGPVPGRWEEMETRDRSETTRGKKKRRFLTGGFISHSLVSKVTMMRMGRLFIPPTQLELHMKLYKIVVNSVPT